MSYLDLIAAPTLSEELAAIDTLNIDKSSLNILLRDIEAAQTERIPIELVITTCPDYSYDSSGKFSFKSINDGIGLIALQTSAALLPLLEVLSRNSIFCRVTFAFGDIEAEDPDILEAMKISSAKFHEAVEQNIVKAYLHLKRILHEEGLDNFIFADSLGMINRFYKPDIITDANKATETVDHHQVNNVALKRTKLVSRMFGGIYERRGSFHDFVTARAQRDINDHIIVGEGVKRERQRGQKVSIVTMSIPELAKFFNYGSETRTPVITINQKY